MTCDRLYLFCGQRRRADLKAALQECGIKEGMEAKVREIDVINGAEQDLDDSKVWDDVLIRIRAGAYAAIVVSPQRSTFSRATLNRTRGPPPMRSAKYPWGFPWILGRRRSKLRQANRLIKKATLACAAGDEAGTPYVLEFPEDLGMSRGGGLPQSGSLRARRALPRRQTATVLRCISVGLGRPSSNQRDC